jgi:uncharacterized integral membrane protein (TIGR00698 family)
MMQNIFLRRLVFVVVAILTLLPQVSAALALFLGMTLALTVENPYFQQAKHLTPKLLQISVVGLGFGMNLIAVQQAGLRGLLYTAVTISLTLFLGLIIGKFLKVFGTTSLLISAGTAICGGSAIAAVAATIDAKTDEVSVSLATVFFLNAVALFIFPPLGHYFGLSQTQFGLWSALAVHDTSSVVGTALQYGAQALQVGTTVKLARALWIVPLSLAIGAWFKPEKRRSVKFPWFILGFILASAVVTYIPALENAGLVLANLAKRFLVLTLFLIGANLSRSTLKAVGLRPLLQGFILWIIVLTTTLMAISSNLISF